MVSQMKKVAVIGGGAAGMMAAVAAAKEGAAVTVYEKNEKLGKKLFITGKGRCNVTNSSDMETVFQNVVTNRKFLYSAFYAYNNENVMEFMEKNGTPLKIERGNRVFPASDKAGDIIDACRRALKAERVTVCCHKEVKEILTDGTGVIGIGFPDGGKADADAVILATGGISYPSTGSTGDGHRMASELGHTVTDMNPGLVGLTAKEEYVKDLQGLSLKNVTASVYQGKKKLYEDFGEMLFTHFGVSGPLMLSASSLIAKKLKGQELTLKIDLKPALDKEQLDRRILREFEENSRKDFKNSLGNLLPQKLIPVVIFLSGIPEEKKVYDISKEERQVFLKVLKEFPLTLAGLRGYNEAIITQGGISVKEVNPSTMESKRVSGLYFAGEILDVDALTGGYNLQIAWSTGYLAGMCAGTGGD